MWEGIVALKMFKNRETGTKISSMVTMAVLSIAIATTCLLVSLSVVSGFAKAYENAILKFNAHVVVIRDGDIENISEIMPVVQKYSHNISPFIFREGLALLPGMVSGVVIKGIDAKTLGQVYPLNYIPVPSQAGQSLPSLLSAKNSIPSVLLGKELFDRTCAAGPCEFIRILIPKNNPSKQLKDFAQTFRVAGSFESGLYEFDSKFVLTSLQSMDTVFHTGEHASGIELSLEDPHQAAKVANEIESELPGDYQAISWDELNEALFSAMKTEKVIFLMIMILLVIVASFNVMGVILMMVLNRPREVAILRAMGASRWSLQNLFSFQGLCVGFLGTLIGIGMSVLILMTIKNWGWLSLDPQIYYVSHLPVDWSPFFWIVLVAVTLCICYGMSLVAARWLLKKNYLIQSFR